MSRWAINPKWLVYLPPTMAPCGTSERDDFLEHPQQAINYYRKRGVKKLICEEKHMGSRAILIICKRVQGALTASGFWEEHNTDWVCLDAELMPWSAKAQSLLKDQYASVSAAARHSLPAAETALQAFVGRDLDAKASALLDKISYKKASIEKYTD